MPVPCEITDNYEVLDNHYEGLVVELTYHWFRGEHYGAIIWDEELDGPRKIRCGEFPDYAPSSIGGSGTVDASPELLAKYNTFKANQRKLDYNVWNMQQAKQVMKDKLVRVVKGRKVSKGTEGKVFWIGPNKYGSGERVGIKELNGTVHWTHADNVEVVNPVSHFKPALGK